MKNKFDLKTLIGLIILIFICIFDPEQVLNLIKTLIIFLPLIVLLIYIIKRNKEKSKTGLRFFENMEQKIIAIVVRTFNIFSKKNKFRK
ncbi:hypothetical protein [Cetobacterium sp.]|uniref:hypothetical protein n=1 Tax=Cetobacterium sp. TaxID=2071632 RepID=UPI003F36825E